MNVHICYGYTDKWIREYDRIHKYGYNPSVNKTWEYIWINGTNYPFLTSVSKFNVSSTDINDDVGGTGAWNITLLGLDSSYVRINETIQLDGQNPVETVNEYIRIHRAYIRHTGIHGVNEGEIYVGIGTPILGVIVNEYLRIEKDEGQSHVAIYTIPLGYTGYITNIAFTSSEDRIVYFSLEKRLYDEGWRCIEHYSVFRSTFINEYLPPRPFPEKTDIIMRSKTGSGIAVISGSFDLILIDNNEPFETSGNSDALIIGFILVPIIALIIGVAKRR